jgi:hypothetical protein
MNTGLSEKLTASADLALGGAGYGRIGNFQRNDDNLGLNLLIYKRLWSASEVEHFIYFSEHPKERGKIVGHFGIRNQRAEDFSVQAIRTYGGPLFSAMWYDRERSCAMRFSLGRPGNDPLWAIRVSTTLEFDLTACIKSTVEDGLLPAIGAITTIPSFLSLLVANAEPCPWSSTNAAIRAAQIVALGGMCGLDFTETQASLESRELWVANSVPKASVVRSNPRAFIAKLREDWEGYCGRG